MILPQSLSAADYFVDFNEGKDTNSGLTKDLPWKHAPGDQNANANPKNITLQPGDSVIFKGGIKYFGSIQLRDSGTIKNPITYSGSSWGADHATISGGKTINTSFHDCSSAVECGDNKYWQHLMYFKVPDKIHPFAPIYIDNRKYWPSRTRHQKDFFWFDEIDTYHSLDSTQAAKIFSKTIMNVPKYASAPSENAWGTPYLSVWVKGNNVILSKITNISESFDTITHEKSLEGRLYDDRDTSFTFFNRPIDVDQQGEFSIDNKKKELIFYRYNNQVISKGIVEVAGDGMAFENLQADNIIISGFRITNFFGDDNDYRSGLAYQQRISNKPKTGIVIENNIVEGIASLTGNGVIELISGNNVLVKGNTISNNLKSSGIRTGKIQDIVIKDNIINRIGRTGIRVMDTQRAIVKNNRISNIRGVHGNGMSFYLGNKNIFVEGNYVDNTQNALTFHGNNDVAHSTNLFVLNNIFFGLTAGWGHEMRDVVLAHNLFVDPSNKEKALILTNSNKNVHIFNNIIGGWPAKALPENWHRNCNYYTSLASTQSEKYGWELGENERLFGGPSAFLKTSKLPNYQTIGKYPCGPIAQLFHGFPENFVDLSFWRTRHKVGPTDSIFEMR